MKKRLIVMFFGILVGLFIYLIATSGMSTSYYPFNYNDVVSGRPIVGEDFRNELCWGRPKAGIVNKEALCLEYHYRSCLGCSFEDQQIIIYEMNLTWEDWDGPWILVYIFKIETIEMVGR